MPDTTTPAGTDFNCWNHHTLAQLARDLTERVQTRETLIRDSLHVHRSLLSRSGSLSTGEIKALKYLIEQGEALLLPGGRH